MTSLLQTPPRKSALGAAFIAMNTLLAIVVSGYHDAAALQKGNEERALALAHGMASVVQEKIRSYGLLLDLASKTPTASRSESEQMQMLDRISQAAPALEVLAFLMRDAGDSLEVFAPPNPAFARVNIRIGSGDPRYAPLVTMLRGARLTGRHQVSNLYYSRMAGGFVVAIATGALERSASPEQFVILIPAKALSDLLASLNVGDGIFAGISDANGNVVARAPQHEGFVGRKVPEWFLTARAGKEDGILTGPPLPGSDLRVYDFAFHRIDELGNWYITLAFPPGALRPAFVIGPATLAWGALAFLVSVLVAWGAYGDDMRKAYVKRRIDAATRELLQGLPGALVQIALPAGGKPRVIVGHGALAPSLAAEGPGALDAVLEGAVEASRSGGLPHDIRSGERTLRIFASDERHETEGGSRLLDAYVLDVTELKHAEAAAASSARLAALGKIYASIAHEVSQPLNVISLAAENGSEFLREGDAPAAQAKFAGIVRQAQQARHIIDRLLVFARGGIEPGQLVRVDLEASLARARELVEVKLTQNQVTLSITSAAPGLRVLAAPLELEHVFLNILLNAIHAIAERGPDGERLIQVRIAPHGEEAIVEIEDTGAGIDQGLIKTAFEPFVTTRPSGSGTGLGLPFVHSAMTAFGGKVEIGNGRSGALVRLTFRLPPPSGA